MASFPEIRFHRWALPEIRFCWGMDQISNTRMMVSHHIVLRERLIQLKEGESLNAYNSIKIIPIRRELTVLFWNIFSPQTKKKAVNNFAGFLVPASWNRKSGIPDLRFCLDRTTDPAKQMQWTTLPDSRFQPVGTENPEIWPDGLRGQTKLRFSGVKNGQKVTFSIFSRSSNI